VTESGRPGHGPATSAGACAALGLAAASVDVGAGVVGLAGGAVVVTAGVA
jgi:hypothetical protein